MNWEDLIPVATTGITMRVFLWRFPTKSDMNRRFVELRSEFREDIRDVRENIKDVRGEVQENIRTYAKLATMKDFQSLVVCSHRINSL